MTEPTPPATGKDFLILLFYFLLGIPMAYYIWHAFSDLLRGVVDPVGLLIAVVLLVVFFGFARLFGRTIRNMAGWEG